MPDDLALAAELVVAAGRLAARMRVAGVDASRKTSVSDIVTEADTAAEALIAERLRVQRPEDGIVGEEGTSRAGARTWYVDPVDGTYNYAAGLPLWCSAVALADGDDTTAAAIYVPVADELWTAGAARPTSCNGQPLKPLTARPLSDVSVAAYLHPATLSDDAVRVPLLRAIRPAATVRMLGSGSVELAAVAAGRLGAFVQYDCLPWDWLPGAALVRGAGGVTDVVERDGRRWYVAGNARTVDDLRAHVLAD